jgi:hypothetical protein
MCLLAVRAGRAGRAGRAVGVGRALRAARARMVSGAVTGSAPARAPDPRVNAITTVTGNTLESDRTATTAGLCHAIDSIAVRTIGATAATMTGGTMTGIGTMTGMRTAARLAAPAPHPAARARCPAAPALGPAAPARRPGATGRPTGSQPLTRMLLLPPLHAHRVRSPAGPCRVWAPSQVACPTLVLDSELSGSWPTQPSRHCR